ncbi:PIN domain-containing protein [Chryseobacterium terrae]|uniref:PIN domain-containing protein n=1 Tax=Chryseobacterium terrae TaxID=3163299 RepID=A0ABW8Y928_9FLAO
MSGDKDMFIINKIFPNAKDIFTVSGRPISEIKNDCLFVFDTNSLILPYTTSSESLDELKKVYTKIIQEKRFFIPGQVAREFARIRPEKIKEVFQQLTKSRNSIPVLGIGKYPLLNGITEYDELFDKEKEINSLVKEYSKQLGKVIEHVKEWSWNDPVSQLYKSLFNDEVIYDIELNEEKIKKELDYRYENKIPPGYEDKNKGDGGIGDLLIWFTILELAEKNKKDIVFISGDEKKDWFYQVDKQSLYPKFELTAEFRGKAPGKTFSIIKLSELLELFGADEKVIEEVESEENTINYFYSAHEEKSTSYIDDWIIKNIKGFHILRYEGGFPEIVLVDSENIDKRIAVEIMNFREVSVFLSNLTSFLENNISKAIEDDCSKLIIFVVVKPQLIANVSGALKKIKQNFKSDELEIEFIFGRVINNSFTTILVV